MSVLRTKSRMNTGWYLWSLSCSTIAAELEWLHGRLWQPLPEHAILKGSMDGCACVLDIYWASHHLRTRILNLT
jgi:hypothetical protein